jgi:hypothetical protein
MIEPEHVTKWRTDLDYDRIAAIVIGLIAVLSAFLGVVHTMRSLEGSRGNLQASRIAADIEARMGVGGVSSGLTFATDEAVLLLRMEGTDRFLAANQAGESGDAAVGSAMAAAADDLRKALDASLATSGSSVDAYLADLLNTTEDKAAAVGAEFNHQYDIAAAAGAHDRLAVLGLSFLGLGGVLTGLAAVFKEGLGGWIALQTAAVLVGLAALLGLLALL